MPYLLVAALGLLADVPVDPDGAAARELARRELAQPIYHERPNLFSIVLQWILDQLARAQGAPLSAPTLAIVVAAVLTVVVAASLVVAGPVARARRVRRGSKEVFGDDTRTAAELRASADLFASQGRWDEAVLDRVRAVLRSLEERALLEPRPGSTAHEATEEAGARLPTCATDLRAAGRLFDDVCYGDMRAGAGHDAHLREVDARVTAARPVPAAPAPAEHGLVAP
ncbi:MAG: DUF4129 domain-containing protein [Cellulomonadaceae bacterium]|nr:DUF4129 domain-containing protein [Cellulomonadaceae bacterium]